MRYFLSAMLLMLVVLCNGQTVRFQLYRTKACSTKALLDTDYSLYKIPGSIDTDYIPKKGTVYLPGPGKYSVSIGDAPVTDTVLDIRDTGLFVFNYKEPDFGLYYSHAVDDPGGYENCGETLNGYCEIKYPNGALRVKGNFFEGREKDSTFWYYPNGQLKAHWQRFSKYQRTEFFDSVGHLTKLFVRQNGSFMLYRWHKVKMFYPNGKTRLIASDDTHVRCIKEYYPDGQVKIEQTKKHRFEYDTTGRLLLSFKWKTQRAKFGRKNEKDFSVRESVFDGSGDLIRIVSYTCENEIYYPPTLKPEKADEINSITVFKNGKVVSSTEDVTHDDYLKIYGDDATGFKDLEW